MATSLDPNPRLFVPPANLTWRNIRYGPHDMQRLNVYKNPVQRTGGNPVLVFNHGGAWTGLDKTSTIEGDRVLRWLFAYLLDSTNYGTDVLPFDIVSVEQRIQGHQLSAATMQIGGSNTNTPYEPIIEGTNPGYGPGTGTISGPWYYHTMLDDVQNGYQWVKDNAERFNFDPERLVGAGFSAGSWATMTAAFSPSRQYTTRENARSRWDRFSDSKIRGCLNYSGEIDIDPWFMAFTVTQYLFGVMESTDANVRADMERLLLVPNSLGERPEGSDPTPLLRQLSPKYRIQADLPENRGIKIRSYYPTFEDTNSADYAGGPLGPVPTYGGAVPPYNAGGHDYHQFDILAEWCSEVGIDHSGAVIALGDYSGDIQLMYEAQLASTYAWLQEIAGF